MSVRLGLLVLATTMCVASASLARDWPTGFDSRRQAIFYNNPDVTLDAFRADLSECRNLADNFTVGTRGGADFTGSVGRGRSVFAGNRLAHIDNCMIVRGYRRFIVSNVPQAQFDGEHTLTDQALLAIVSTANPPVGVMEREWDNRFYLAERESEWRLPPRRGMRAISAPITELPLRYYRYDELSPSEPINPGPNDMVIVVSIRPQSTRYRYASVSWVRIDPSSGDFAATNIEGHAHERVPHFEVRSDLRPRATGGDWSYFVYVVPAGAYALSYFRAWSFGSNLCLGSIMFEGRAGDVLYLGDVHAISPRRYYGAFRIDQNDADAARAAFLQQTNLAADLQAAELINGVVTPCTARNRWSRIDWYAIPGLPVWQAPEAVEP